MKNLNLMYVALSLTLVMWGLASGTDWQVVYQTDFSADPGWATNNSSHYYWDSSDQTYYIYHININYGGEYAYYDTGYTAGSFRLEWDVNMLVSNYATGIAFGLFDTDLYCHHLGNHAWVSFVRGDRGQEINLGWLDLGGVEGHMWSTWHYELDTWYHVVLEYDAGPRTLTSTVTSRDGAGTLLAGSHRYRTFRGGYGPGGHFEFEGRSLPSSGSTFIGKVDNVVFATPEPPCEPEMVWVYIDDPGVSGHEGFTGYMSKYETTNAQYCQFLNAAKATGDITVSGNYVYGANGTNSGADFVGQLYYDLAGAGYNYCGVTGGGAARINYSGGVFSVDSGFENHPVTHVSWYGATVFCNYYGYRLPTEWEWKAVADYDGSYPYPCGPTINNSIANYCGSTHPDGTTTVGAFGTYGYEMCDMAGNVWEWASNLWDPPQDGDRSECGLCWANLGQDFATVWKSPDHPYNMHGTLGFRVCRSEPAIEALVDIKPGSCPNPLNVDSKGILTVAILGSEDFDISSIDIASVRLEDVGAIRSSTEDVATPIAEAPMTAGPIAYWSFDDPADPGHDDSGNGHNGTVNGAAPVDGICEKALYFNGTDDYVDIAGTSDLHLFSGFTLSAWACFTNYIDDGSIVGKHDGWPNGYVLGVVQDKFDFYFQGTRLLTNETYSDGLWHHLAGTYDGTSHQQNFYVDGDLVQSQTIIYDITNSANITIGKTSTAFEGKIDEVRIYDRALSASEIQDLADANCGDRCECTTAGPDGFVDLVLKFETEDIVEAIGEVNDGDVLPLSLTGLLQDGTLIEGADCIVVRGKHKPFNKGDINKDGKVDTVDFAIVAENWLESTIQD